MNVSWQHLRPQNLRPTTVELPHLGFKPTIIKEVNVTRTVPPGLPMPTQAGKLSPTELARYPRARMGLVLTRDDGMPTVCALNLDHVALVRKAQLGPVLAHFKPERWGEVE